MNTANIRRSIIRLVGIVAVMAGLVMTSGIAGATNNRVGLTECNYDYCRVVTQDDLRGSTRGTKAVPAPRVSFPSGRFDPRFTQ